MSREPAGWLSSVVISGAFLFLRDGRLYVRCDVDGPIRLGTAADRHSAVLALQRAMYAVPVGLLPPGHPDAVIIPLAPS